MDKSQHPQVIRTWKVERIRKPGNAQSQKIHQSKSKKTK
jgi:hypothetical protein